MSDGQWRQSGRGTNPVTVLDTALNSLGSGSAALSAAQSNDDAAELDQIVCVELDLAGLGAAPSLAAPVELYVCYSFDGGTTFGDGGASVVPVGQLVGVFPLRAVATAQVITLPQPIVLLPLDHKWLLRNNTAQAFASSGNALKVYYGGF